MKLTKEEKELLKDFKNGKLKSLGPRERKRHIRLARAHIKEKRIVL